MAETGFIAEMADALRPGVELQGMRVIVDGMEEETTPALSLLSIDFHLAGPSACTANFTFTFASDRTIEENLAALSDFIHQQNAVASRAPEAATGGVV